MSLKPRLAGILKKKLDTLDVILTEDDQLVSDVKSVIEEVMNATRILIKPETTELTEEQFIEIYKSVCFTQDSDVMKKKIGDSLYEEFYQNRQKYIFKYRQIIGKVLTEVQKELSEKL